jgi:uncharacterized protein
MFKFQRKITHMTDQEIIVKTIEFVRIELKNAEGGHDWWHIARVLKNAQTISRSENVNMFVVQLGALLHDIADHKFNDGDESAGLRKTRNFLQSLAVDEAVIGHVEKIMTNISFKGGNFSQVFSSDELNVVQDADRLDAIGAIGVARAFNYGGFKGREMFNPAIQPHIGMTVEQYKSSTAPTINHFHEKLLLLKDRMNTETGRRMAEQRHRFMEQFLAQFYSEWDGQDVPPE